MDNKGKISVKLILTLLFIFLAAMGSAFSNAVIGDVRNRIGAARRELTSEREANAALRAQITQKYTLDEVERIAKEKLGMNKPDASQIIWIEVPRQSHVVLNDEREAYESDSGFFKRIADYVTDTVKRFISGE